DYETTLDYTGIVVGYSLQSFIVAEGRICGAVKEEKLNAERIRVMLMTTGYKSLFHEQVVISSAEGFSVNSDEESRHFNGGEETVFSIGDEAVHGKRVRIVPDGTNKLMVKSIRRSQGNPEYSGTLEVEAFDEGLVIVNDVNMEDYVSHVIPSEMPSSFGLEALKVQAVCARSYAYKELTNTHYSMYGAHVDDSVQYQVYNNTSEINVAEEAAKSTCGQLLVYNDEVVQTYYYSTSCGVTTDVSLWGSDTGNYPYYKSVSVGSEKHNGDLCNEEEFFSFITNAYPSDYDSGFPLYRWNMTIDCARFGENVSAKTGCSIGNVENVQVNKRTAGGAALSITITGSQGSVTLDKESQIRTVLGNGSVDLNTQNGTARYERLPSSFITFAPVYNEEGSLSGFTIYGGGYGHGIGMSQNAVKAMSQTMDYVQILKFFYKDTQIRMVSG
ncbi:MAG: SpoIID/LytB domain-containing protein, partial [Eubacteriales bacterium]|nr:SpoIID/LytB domain-containing protein [Eubacteriales bacterium]